MTTLSGTYPARTQDIQDQFSVSVVTPTVLRPTLKKAIQSIYAQKNVPSIQLMLGVDKNLYDNGDMLRQLIEERPDHVGITVVDPGYSTFSRNGGLYQALGGGAMRPVLTLLANSRYVAYLDDDNWMHKTHLSGLLQAIEGKEWAYSFRWFCAPDGEVLGYDINDSTGEAFTFAGVDVASFADPNTMMIDKIACEQFLLSWLNPFLDDGHGADRRFARDLFRDRVYGISPFFSSFYRFGPDETRYTEKIYQAAKESAKANSETKEVKFDYPQTIRLQAIRSNWLRPLRRLAKNSRGITVGVHDPEAIKLAFDRITPDKVIAFPPGNEWGDHNLETDESGLLAGFLEGKRLEIRKEPLTEETLATQPIDKSDWVFWQIDCSDTSKPVQNQVATLLPTYVALAKSLKPYSFLQVVLTGDDKRAEEITSFLSSSLSGSYHIDHYGKHSFCICLGWRPNQTRKSGFVRYRSWKGGSVHCKITARDRQKNLPQSQDFSFQPQSIIHDLPAFWREKSPIPYCYDATEDRVLAVTKSKPWVFDMQTGFSRQLYEQAEEFAFFKRDELAGLCEGLAIPEVLPESVTLLLQEDQDNPDVVKGSESASGQDLPQMLDGDVIVSMLNQERSVHLPKIADADLHADILRLANLFVFTLKRPAGVNLLLNISAVDSEKRPLARQIFSKAKLREIAA